MYLSFNPGALGPKLGLALAQGKAFQIELAVYRTNPADGSSALVDDYQFGLADLSLHAVSGTIGSFAIDDGGNWQYHLTNPAAAKATGQPTTKSFNVLSIDGSASVDVAVTVAVSTHPGPLSFTGTAEADTLSGGADADILIGGGGKVAFLFDTLPIKGAQDKIMDFAIGEDKIQISRSVFSAFGGHAASQLSDADSSFATKATSETQHLV